MIGALAVPSGAVAGGKLSQAKAKKVTKREARRTCKGRSPYRCQKKYKAYSCERQSRKKVDCEGSFHYWVNARTSGVCTARIRVVKKGGRTKTRELRSWSCLN